MRIGSQLLSFFAATTFLGSSLAAPQAVTSSSGTTVDATNANATAASAAEEALKQAALLLASMPDCGVSTTGCCIKSTWTGWQSTVQRNCLTEAIATSPCELTDLACSCSNATITAEVQVCILQSCTVKQSLTSQNATETLCGAPMRNESKTVSYAGVIGGVLAVIAYLLRMISRLPCFGGTLGWDDAVITIAMLEVIPLSVFSVILADLGLGTDIWTVPFDNLTSILKVYYFDEDLYLTCLPLVKISMLLFYLRIFPQRWFRISCFVAMAACAAYGIAFLLVSVWQCRPISLAWHNWDGEHAGVCNDINAQGWTSAALNVILDIIVLALPLPLIYKLQLNKRKKALVLLMFSVGFVVTIISILRLQVLVNFGGSNFTWGYRAVGYWSTTEVDLAVICTCMPGIRGLISFAMPRMMGESTRAKSPGPSAGYSGFGTGKSGLSSKSFNRASQPSRAEILSKGEKDWIPLVEVDGSKSEITASSQVTQSSDDKEWPLQSTRAGGAWVEPAAWESTRAPRRATLERRNSGNLGARWKVSMDS